MGQGSSSVNGSPAGRNGGAVSGGGSSGKSRFPRLPSTGRYATYKMENGAVVHLLGVVPASSISAEEAHDLVSAVKPRWLYVDEHPELVEALKEDVATGKVGAGFAPTETPRDFKLFPGAGIFGSILIRTKLVDNEMFALLGAELFAPYKAGMAAALKPNASPFKGPADAASTSASAAGPTGASSSPSGPAAILSYPFPLAYNNYESVQRPSHWEAKVVGDNMTQSSAVRGSVYNGTLELTGAPPLVAIEAAVPAERGYFTRRDLTELQFRNQARINEVALRATAASPQIDVEGRIMEQENAYIQAGDASSQAILYQAGVASQSQSQAVAYTLHQAASKLEPGEHGVALVNIGTMASLQRNWSEPRAPSEVFPPMHPVAVAAGYVLPTAAGGGALYGLYRAFRRFPKSTVAGTVVVGGLGTLMLMGIAYPENTLYGPFIRPVLARPRVTAPTGKIGSGPGGLR